VAVVVVDIVVGGVGVVVLVIVVDGGVVEVVVPLVGAEYF